MSNNGIHPDMGLTLVGSRANAARSNKRFRLSQLRELRGSEQVAAVCYRIGKRGIEFLLVRTGGGRWIFPKGGIEPGLTYAQSAALEAFEEAGVHGRIEEASFARYVGRKRERGGSSRGSKGAALAVHAHLCEVLRQGSPIEANRHPQWFCAEKAIRRLLENRSPDDGAELAEVVEQAATRIKRMRDGNATWNLTKKGLSKKDALQRVAFEAPGAIRNGHIEETRYVRVMRRENRDAASPEQVELAINAQLRRVLRLGPGRH